MTDLFSLIFILAFAFAPAVLWLWYWRRTPFTLIQYLMDTGTRLYVRLFWRASVPTSLPVPRDRGALLVANHRSSIDPFFIQVAAGRVVHWMVAEEFCKHFLFRDFLRHAGAIPTRRGGSDSGAIREAVRLLKAGELVGVLPEGRINTTEAFMLPVRPGAAMIAGKAGVPIIPIHIEGAPYAGTPISPFLMPAKVEVRFGTPVETQTSENGDRDTETVILEAVKAIAELAGEHDFQPQLAGKSWKPTEAEKEAALIAARRRARQR
ncbi:MAG: lysophospholipid acyltransferase family protein [Pirellulaceae bacterium]